MSPVTSDLSIWIVILALGIGTFLIRWSFLATLGDRDLPPIVIRMLRYTAVAGLPAATGGQPEPARLSAAAVTIAVGVLTKNVILSIVAGATVLFAMLYVLG